MKSGWMIVAGVVLVLVGVAGVAIVLTQVDAERTARPDSADSDVGPYVVPEGRGPMGRRFPRYSDERASLGEAIYLDGVGADGRTVPRTAIGPGMMGGGCVICHGIDGEGGRIGMMGRAIEAPSITYEALTSEHEHGESGWTDAEIRTAVEEGVEPDGEELDPFMPRWDFTDEEFDALLDYLKELSEP